MSTLKAELKAWEADFRASHGGRNPTKDDIKQDPEIADKYKAYNKTKAPVKPAKDASTSSSSTVARDLPPSVLPSSAAIFKTPTKPSRTTTTTSSGDKKPSTSVSSASAALAQATSSTSPQKPFPPPGSPSKQIGTTTYVMANSPSKLRALAGAYSFSGSPNGKSPTKKQQLDNPFAVPDSLASSSSSSTLSKKRTASMFAGAGAGGGGGGMSASPKKYNPFAAPSSPQKKKKKPKPTTDDNRWENFFGAPAPPLKRTASTSSSQPLYSTSLPSHPASVSSQDRLFSRTSSRGSSVFHNPASEAMDRDEALGFDVEAEGEEEEEEEVLGPSPVKPGRHAKVFQPLLVDPPPPSTSTSSQHQQQQSQQKKVFEGEFTVKPRLAAGGGGAGQKVAEDSGKVGKTQKRGRELPALGREKKARSPESSEGENSDACEGKKNGVKVAGGSTRGKKGKGKATTTTTNPKPTTNATKKPPVKKPKFTHRQPEEGEDDVEMDEDGVETLESVERQRERGTFVLALDSDEEGEEEDEGEAVLREMEGGGVSPKKQKASIKVVVRPRGAYGKGREGEAGAGEGLSSLFYKDDADIMTRGRRVGVRGDAEAHHAEEEGEYNGDYDDEDSKEDDMYRPHYPASKKPIDPSSSIVIDPSIPSSLLSLLSLRTSPFKTQSREKDRDWTVKKLLREPSAVKARKGLEDLEDADEEEEGEWGGDGEGRGEDDDWESDAEGWKEEVLGGEVMDGYDDVRW